MEGSDLFSDGEWTRAQQELGLSRRQAQIVRLVLEGNADKQIAQKAEHLHDHGCARSLHRLFEKFKLNDRLELTLLVLASLRGRLGRSSARPLPDVPNSIRHPDSDAIFADSSEEDEQGQLRDEDTVQ